jgi:hypothetical protein
MRDLKFEGCDLRFRFPVRVFQRKKSISARPVLPRPRGVQDDDQDFECRCSALSMRVNFPGFASAASRWLASACEAPAGEASAGAGPATAAALFSACTFPPAG